MDYISLLWDDVSTKESSFEIAPNVFEDVKLDGILSLCLNIEQKINVLDVLKKACSDKLIKFRQDIVEELLRNEHLRDIFILLKGSVYRMKKIYNFFLDDNAKDLKSVYFFEFAKYYQQLIREAAEEFGKLKTTLDSEAIDRLKSFFISTFSSKQYSEVEDRFKRVNEHLETLLKCRIEILRKYGEHVEYRIHKYKAKDTLAVHLAQLFGEIGFGDAQVMEFDGVPKYNISAELLDVLKALDPKLFDELDEFYEQNKDYFNTNLLDLYSETDFYLSMYRFYTYLQENNIPIARPALCDQKHLEIRDAYDISLMCKNETNIRPNDFDFNEEGFYILTGPNGGGKTTYLRALGICMVLYLTGGYIPAKSAKIGHIDVVHTHFPSDEQYSKGGRLSDEISRAESIANAATFNSVVLLNETFSSTDAQYSLKLSLDIMRRLMKKGSFGIFVTHHHEMIRNIYSMNAEPDVKTQAGVLTALVDKENQNIRTYKIQRTKPEFLSYAKDILEKYGVTRLKLTEKLSAKNIGRW